MKTAFENREYYFSICTPSIEGIFYLSSFLALENVLLLEVSVGLRGGQVEEKEKKDQMKATLVENLLSCSLERWPSGGKRKKDQMKATSVENLLSCSLEELYKKMKISFLFTFSEKTNFFFFFLFHFEGFIPSYRSSIYVGKLFAPSL